MTEKSKQLPVVEELGVEAVAQSALGDVPPSLQGLFDRDPLGLTVPEKGAIVAALREQRRRFMEAEATAKSTGRRVNAKKAVKGERTGASIDLEKLLDEM